MAMRDVQITGLDHTYRDTKVTIGGHEFPTDALSGLNINACVGHRTTLTLDVLTMDRSSVSGEMDVTIPDSTRAALVALGWTPPADGQE